jgi:transposase
MNPFSSSQRFFLYRSPTDMRRSFSGLSGIVTNELKMSLTTGDVFIFINKPRNSIKLLVWDRNGFVIYYKRLEQGTFQIPESPNGLKEIKIRWGELVMLLEGLELRWIKQRKRYAFPQEAQ